MKIQKKKIFFYFFLGGGGGRRVGVQGGCERRSKVFVKIQKKIEGEGWVGVGGGRGVRSGVGLGEVRGSKVWVRWVMLGIGDVNQE